MIITTKEKKVKYFYPSIWIFYQMFQSLIALKICISSDYIVVIMHCRDIPLDPRISHLIDFVISEAE